MDVVSISECVYGEFVSHIRTEQQLRNEQR